MERPHIKEDGFGEVILLASFERHSGCPAIKYMGRNETEEILTWKEKEQQVGQVCPINQKELRAQYFYFGIVQR